MVVGQYIPHRGDFVVISFDPQTGREQKGRRPALIVSNALFNRATGLAIVCPITNTNRNIPFHIPIPPESSLTGYIMTEQIKSIDFSSRKIKKIEQAPAHVIIEVLSILDTFIYQNG